MKRKLIIIICVYLSALFLQSFPYSPVAIDTFNCDIVRRADYVFPARQIYCWLDTEVAND